MIHYHRFWLFRLSVYPSWAKRVRGIEWTHDRWGWLLTLWLGRMSIGVGNW